MLSEDAQYIICELPGCPEQIPNHYWGKVHSDGWFHGKDGKSYCPYHIPSWVEKWRGR